MVGEFSRRDNREFTLQDKIASPRKLPFQYLKEITNNFSAQRVLGGGAFGVVYKGLLPTGDLMAVKKLTALIPGSEKQFENEVYHLMCLNHPNIVRCIGYCYETQNLCLKHDGTHIFAETTERLLCLEYMPNGSLDNHLADELCGLDWHKRYNIISGICYGLHYIHTEWQVNTPIIHLDLKPANILLGDNMQPKIADFGLSRLLGEQQTRVWTESRHGTPGYMAPEYINRGIITTKSDIFSLGMIIIEIITGCRNYPWPSATGTLYHDFVELVLKKWRKRSEAASLETDYQQIRSCLEMGLSCLETDPEKRPATMEIIERLIGWGSTNFHVGSHERSSTLQRSGAFGGSSLIGGKGHQQVEAKRPALLFKWNLTGFLQKAPPVLFDHWQSIVNILTEYMHVLKSNYVPSFLICKMFTQVFSFIDVQLFNTLLLSGCCSLGNGGHIKAGLAKLEQWCTYETEEYAGSSWEELKHIRKAAILLTMSAKQKKALKEINCKQKKTLKEIICHLCPVLSIPHVNFPFTFLDEEEYGVLKRLKSLLEKQGLHNAVGLSVLLEDDLASIPFTVDDVLKSMTEFGLADVDMPPLIWENPCFNFLRQ
ncbi:hypothetical protein ACQ4PT_036141 [Festuca glaucescens]